MHMFKHFGANDEVIRGPFANQLVDVGDSKRQIRQLKTVRRLIDRLNMVIDAEHVMTETRQRMNDAGIEVSLFIAPSPRQVDAAAKIGAQFIELHTGAYAEHFHNKRERNAEIERLIAASRRAHWLGLRVNAGHGLNYQNLPLLHLVPHLVELNIGHSIVSRAVFVGLTQAVKEMLKLMEKYPG